VERAVQRAPLAAGRRLRRGSHAVLAEGAGPPGIPAPSATVWAFRFRRARAAQFIRFGPTPVSPGSAGAESDNVGAL